MLLQIRLPYQQLLLVLLIFFVAACAGEPRGNDDRSATSEGTPESEIMEEATTADAPAPASEEPAPDEGSAFRNSLLQEVNAVRTAGCRCGGQQMPPVAPLRWNPQLETAASRHVRDMAQSNQLSHTGSNGSDVGQRATKAGYTWGGIAENIAQGHRDVPSVVAGWVKSPGHCMNIMNSDYQDMGVAREDDYWTQVFGKPL